MSILRPCHPYHPWLIIESQGEPSSIVSYLFPRRDLPTPRRFLHAVGELRGVVVGRLDPSAEPRRLGGGCGVPGTHGDAEGDNIQCRSNVGWGYTMIALVA